MTASRRARPYRVRADVRRGAIQRREVIAAPRTLQCVPSGIFRRDVEALSRAPSPPRMRKPNVLQPFHPQSFAADILQSPTVRIADGQNRPQDGSSQNRLDASARCGICRESRTSSLEGRNVQSMMRHQCLSSALMDMIRHALRRILARRRTATIATRDSAAAPWLRSRSRVRSVAGRTTR